MDARIEGAEIRSRELLCHENTRISQAQLLYHYIRYTLPEVKKRLHHWAREASFCVDQELCTQALNSIAAKDFHCQGGAVFAVPYPDHEELLIKLIVAYQTLCDYLDNLCDRADCLDGQAFRELHTSLIDALTPNGEKHSYYRSYPYHRDGGYIDKLVDECRQCLQQLSSYNLVSKEVLSLVQMYIDLQVKKHIGWEVREKTLIEWANAGISEYPDIYWQEFAAATGSTLAVFALLGLASRDKVYQDEIQTTLSLYFPWICGLHILLDYFIDQEEDRLGGDLNFTFYYPDQDMMINRIKTFIREAHARSGRLPRATFTKTVIEGLLAMYFSDPKVKKQGFYHAARELIKESGRGALYTYHICLLVRKFI